MTLAWLLSLNHERVYLVTRDGTEAAAVSVSRSLQRLPELRLPDHVVVSAEVPPADELIGVIVAVPAQSFRAAGSRLAHLHEVPVLSAAKGIEVSTGLRMSEILAASHPANSVAVLSGPNLAHEVARGLPAAAVIASISEQTANLWQSALGTPFFRFYTSRDVTGVELAGALKNVIAIAAGAANGLHLGANAIAAIVTRGLAEITRLGIALDSDPLTFQGLAGVGDLAATCFSPLSRNHRLGELLAEGRTPDEAMAAIGEAVEGAATARVALRLAARVSVDLPIAAQVVAVLDGDCDVPTAMSRLLNRPRKAESSNVDR